jgi:hypothetical protein
MQLPARVQPRLPQGRRVSKPDTARTQETAMAMTKEDNELLTRVENGAPMG